LFGQCKVDFLKNKIGGVKKTVVTTEAVYEVAYTTAYISVNCRHLVKKTGPAKIMRVPEAG